MTLTPEGDVVTLSEKELNVARRFAGLTELEPGGLIVMSADVNAEAGSGVKNWAKGFMKTWWDRLTRSKSVDDELKRLIKKRGMDTGWSIGNLFKGRYYSKSLDKMFSEKSFSIEIRGVPFDFVREAGEVLRKKFDQEAVLLVDYDGNKTYLLD